MTRKKSIAAVATVVSCVLCTHAAAVVIPGIAGTVRDENGSLLQGAVIRLFLDDGDGQFNPSSDIKAGDDFLTGADGSYAFRNIDAGQYFVQANNKISPLINPAAPSLIVDDFQHSRTVIADPIGPISTSSLAVPTAEVIGGERDLYVELMSGVGDIELKVNPFNTEVLEFNTSSGVNGKGVVTWDGVDNSGSLNPAMGLNGFDLTNNGQNEAFIFKLGVDATGAGESMTLRIFDSSPDKFSDLDVPFPVSGGRATEMMVVPFDQFQGDVSPTHVDAIQLILGRGTKSIDAQVDFVGVLGMAHQDFQITAIPEPSGLALAWLGMIGFLLHRRRN